VSLHLIHSSFLIHNVTLGCCSEYKKMIIRKILSYHVLCSTYNASSCELLVQTTLAASSWQTDLNSFLLGSLLHRPFFQCLVSCHGRYPAVNSSEWVIIPLGIHVNVWSLLLVDLGGVIPDTWKYDLRRTPVEDLNRIQHAPPVLVLGRNVLPLRRYHTRKGPEVHQP
jgi:hypothetical protein